MRREEAASCVASRIAQFETSTGSQNQLLACDNEKGVVGNVNNNNGYKRGGTPVAFGSGSRYLDLDDIIEESSIGTDDGGEEEEEDSDGYLAASNEETTSSPDTSFRLSGRSSSSSDRDSTGSSPGSGPPPPKTAISEKLSQKSLDSGYSDYSDRHQELHKSRDIDFGETNEGIQKSREIQKSLDSGFSDYSDRDREQQEVQQLKSAVVHETHSNRDSSKLHHVSKVYFYSVSEILQHSSTEFEDHLSLLKAETGPELSQHQGTTPRIDSSVCEEEFFDRVESPFLPICSPRGAVSPTGATSPFQRWPRVHTGTSSLRRKTRGGEGSPVATPSQSPFPLTNGSLYSDHSLRKEREVREERRRERGGDPNTSTGSQASLPLEEYGLDLSSASLRELNLPLSGPVGSWLGELASVQESECTIMLQSKPVRRAVSGDEVGERPGLGDLRERVRGIQARAHTLSNMFAGMCRDVGESSKPRLVSQVHSLAHQIQLFFLECQQQQCGILDYSHFPGYTRHHKSEQSQSLSELRREQEKLLQLCDSIKLSVSKEQQQGSRGREQQGHRVALIKLITLIGATFSRVVELILSIQISSSVSQLVDGGSELLAALQGVTGLALEGNALCRLLVRAGAVKQLLSLCSICVGLEVRVASLRALGSICCVLEGIEQFRLLEGARLVVGVLEDSDRGEEERREAAGVLAQVSSPWIDGNTGLQEMEESLQEIVASLKDLISSSSSLETFLLCSAALANLTSMLPSSLPTVSPSLLLLLLSHPAASSSSVYILEQLVTIVVNMAKLPTARSQLVRAGGLSFLFSVLALAGVPEPSESVVRAATERTVSKAAIALARLCLEPPTADTVVRTGGLEKLFPLAEGGGYQCETIRIAAMAAIKTISVYSSLQQSSSPGYYSTERQTPSLESFV